MGLFDRFGAGGGKLEVLPSSVQVAPGQVLEGRVVFAAGSRSQQITSVTLKLAQTLHYMEQTPQGPQHRTRANTVAPDQIVASNVTTEPGNRHEFPFRIQLPQQLQSTQPQVCTYRLSCSADIDNEIDPGAGVEIQVVGGMMGQPMGMPGQPMMGQPMGMPGQPMMGQPMMGQPMGMPGQPMMGQPMMGQPMGMPGQPMMGQAMGVMGAVAGAMGAMGGMPGAPGMMPGVPAPLGIGSRVLAQWQDGQFHPGTIVQAQNGYFAVDWENPALGATAWVAPQQVQPAPMGMPGQPMMGQPMMGQPMMGQPQMGMPAQPMMSHAQVAKTPLGIGSPVTAQGPDGGYHAGRVAGHGNGYIAVDWENPKLGPTAWVAETQVKAR